MSRPADTVTVAPAAPAPAQPAVAPPSTARERGPATVTAAIVSEPSGARVVREKDGAVIGMTPFRETWPSGGGVLKLRLELDGYRTEISRGAARSGRRPVVRDAQGRRTAEPPKHKDAKHTPAAHVRRENAEAGTETGCEVGTRSAVTR